MFVQKNVENEIGISTYTNVTYNIHFSISHNIGPIRYLLRESFVFKTFNKFLKIIAEVTREVRTSLASVFKELAFVILKIDQL